MEGGGKRDANGNRRGGRKAGASSREMQMYITLNVSGNDQHYMEEAEGWGNQGGADIVVGSSKRGLPGTASRATA